MAKESRRILVVDDEPKIVEVVASFLEREGFAILSAETGRQALEIFERESVALIVLDLMLPDISGEDVCRIIRERSRVPIIMLTAKSGESDLLRGLGLGADDYIVKPFSLKALHARIEAVLRRSDGMMPSTDKNGWSDGRLLVDFEKSTVRKGRDAISLTPSEWKILTALIKYPGKVFTRAELIEIALGADFDGYDRAVDSHIKNLRQKIEDDPKSPAYVLTIHGFGYKFGGD